MGPEKKTPKCCEDGGEEKGGKQVLIKQAEWFYDMTTSDPEA